MSAAARNMRLRLRALLILAAVLCGMLAYPADAWAADYQCSQVDLTAVVETDGSATVTDQRIFEFPGDGEARETLKWLYAGFPENAEVKVKRVRLAPVDDEGNVVDEWTKLKSTTFQIPWRGGGRPEADGWAFDRFQDTLYAFVQDLPEKAVVEVTYKVSHAVEAYDDAADFQWLYAPLDYAVDLHQVTAKVILPVAANAAVEPSENVLAWGHGPKDGTVEISQDGSITFTDPSVASSAYAEGRVMFPVGWLTNLSEEDRLANQGSLQYQWTAQYEEGWVDRDAHRLIMRDSLASGLMGACALFLVVALLVYARWGRERPPSFTDDYWCEVPDGSLSPAEMGRLWRWNHESPDDAVAMALDLVRRGIVGVRYKAGRPAALLLPTADRLEDDCLGADDRATLRLLEALAEGADRLTLADLSSFAHQRPQAFLEAEHAWQQGLSRRIEAYGFFDNGSRRAQRAMLVLAALIAVAAVLAFLWLGWFPALLSLATAAAVGVLANYTMRRSVRGNEITAHAKALRNWMRDGGWSFAACGLTVGERAELVPYGYLFGVLRFLKPLGENGRALGTDAAEGAAAPVDAADQLAELAPKLSTAFDDALRVAHHRAEVRA